MSNEIVEAKATQAEKAKPRPIHARILQAFSKHKPKTSVEHQSNILDEIHDQLDPRVWDDPASPEPKLKPEHSQYLHEKIYSTLEEHGYDGMETWLSLVFTGSLTTYQYSDESDVDISLFVDTANFPEWSRAEMIGVMVDNCDGTTLPGTPFPLQCFVVGRGLTKADLYKPGLRSGYDLALDQWLVPPDRSRVHDVESEMNEAYTIALETADKMERLLRYEPDKAIMLWHQVHKRRQRDHSKGRGDYSPSNITYKMLANRGLFPQISEVSGEYIARTSMAERTGDPKLDAAIAEFMMLHHEELGNVRDYSHPEVAWGQCEVVARECAEFLKAKGFRAHMETDDLDMWEGYENAQKSEDIGAGDFTYPEHAMVSIYNENSLPWWQIDFTAAQYGFKEFPKVEPGPSGPLIGPQQQEYVAKKLAMANGTFYHVAPTQYREQIEQQGLLPSHDAPSSPWSGVNWDRSQQPPGVYLWDDPRNAHSYAYALEGQKMGREGEFPGDRREMGEYDEDYDRYMEGAPDSEEDENAFFEYSDAYKPKPLYDVWKVNTLGHEPQIDPEMALFHGQLTAEEAQQQINQERKEYGQPETTEGHRWYVPHTITPDRLELHHEIYPDDLTERGAEDVLDTAKRVPDAWAQVPLSEWSEKARKRYLGQVT